MKSPSSNPSRSDGRRSLRLFVLFSYAGYGLTVWVLLSVIVLDYSVEAIVALASISAALLLGAFILSARAPASLRARMFGLLRAGGRVGSPAPPGSWHRLHGSRDESDRPGAFDPLDPSDPLNRARWEDDMALPADSPGIDDAAGDDPHADIGRSSL